MHEFGIAQSILDSVLKKVEEHDAKSVTRIELRVGALKMVTPVSLQNAFDIISLDTKASQAKLDVKEVPGDELTVMNIEVEKID